VEIAQVFTASSNFGLRAAEKEIIQMAAVTGSKTVTKDQAPHLTAAQLTALMAIAPEDLTLNQLGMLKDALSRVPAASDPSATVGSCLP
jgi:hypothetical protein